MIDQPAPQTTLLRPVPIEGGGVEWTDGLPLEEGDYDLDDCADEVDCGLMRDGQCLLAGTEHCDWDCGRLG